MIRLRFIDQRGQLVLGIISLFSIPFTMIFGVLLGLIILGVWQLLSAGLNTITFLRCGLKKKITAYWISSTITLAVLFFSIAISSSVGLVVIPGGAAIAIYYLKIYNDLIVHLKLRKELSGLLKS